MPRSTAIQTLTLVAAAVLAACDATTVGEPIGEERSRSEGTGAADQGEGSTGSSGVEGTIMNEADAAAWCQTYVYERHPYAATEPAPGPGVLSEFGKLIGYDAVACDDGPTWRHVLWRPSVENCVRNILHAPCAASVAALDQCVDGVIAGWSARQLAPEAPCPSAGSCDAFLAASCDDVVVHEDGEGEGGNFGGFEVE